MYTENRAMKRATLSAKREMRMCEPSEQIFTFSSEKVMYLCNLFLCTY